MSLRDFLLDYAEKAPKAERVELDDPMIRFNDDDGDRIGICPLELTFPGDYLQAAKEYGLTFDETDLIVDAADGGDTPEARPWRAILEKLAEPDEVRR